MRPTASGLASKIRDEARRLGFFKTGIAAARPLPDRDFFDDWLESGMHGEMRYMERQAEKRLDPRRILEDARSMLVLAMNYYAEAAVEHGRLKGMISRYARGDDYHAAVKDRLERLLEFIRRQEPSAQGICYADTGPVMEKVWGDQTALGWLGKHTNLITREKGSWFFLGVILLNLDLEPDRRTEDYCGRCTRCIQACPTGAIVAPYVLDARLCISYLTIELRGPIPVQLRPLIGNRIFGCDDCQDVCPWNRFAVPTAEDYFRPRAGAVSPDLPALARITPEEFRLRFQNSPVLRATRDGFVRNVVVALGNSRAAEAVPVLKKALEDPSPLVRSHAEWALAQLAGD